MANIIRITRFYGKDGLMNDKYCVDYDEPVTRNYKTWKTYTIKGEMLKKHFNFIMNATSTTEYKNGVKYREVYEQPTSEEQIASIMLCDADGNEIYLSTNVSDMCRYIQENHKNILGNVYMAYGTYNKKTKYFEKNDYSEYDDFVEMYAENFDISINEILGTDDTIVNSYSGTEQPTATEEPTKYYDTDVASADVKYTLTGGFVGDAKETLNNIYGMTATSNYNGIEYPEKEDCKDCISKHDCKHKLTFQFNEKCELKQPVELYVDMELLKLSDIRATLETLFERNEKFKDSYLWHGDNGNTSMRETKNKYYSIPEQKFSAFGDLYTIEFKVDYHRNSVYKYPHYTMNGKRVTLASITALYKRVCKRISEISNVE